MGLGAVEQQFTQIARPEGLRTEATSHGAMATQLKPHHVIRHNAVGWPLTGGINAFTMSLVNYPIIATGLLL
jgi:hypothetical protein